MTTPATITTRWRALLTSAKDPPSLTAAIWREALAALATDDLGYVSARTLARLFGVTSESLARAYDAAGGVPLILIERQLHQAHLRAPVTSQAAPAPPCLDVWLLLKATGDGSRLEQVVRRALAGARPLAPLPPVHGGRFHDRSKGGRGRSDDDATALLPLHVAPSSPSAPSLPYPARFWAVDVESTGGGSEDRITEIALVLFEHGEPTGVHAALLDPERPIPEHIVRRIGITDAMVRGKPRFDRIAAKVRGYLDGSVVVWHSSSSFDRRLITRELERCGLTWPRTLEEIDTQREAKRADKPQALGKLCADLGIPLERHHRAEHDAVACGRALVALRLLREDKP